MLDENSKIFLVHVAALKALEISIHLFQIGQIISDDHILVIALKQNKILIKVLIKYLDFSDIFL